MSGVLDTDGGFRPDRAFALRLARYCARNPVALERLTYDADVDQVTYRSDKTDGPTAGTVAGDPLEFLARVVTHIPNPGQVDAAPLWLVRQPDPGSAAPEGARRTVRAGSATRAATRARAGRPTPAGSLLEQWWMSLESPSLRA